MSAGKAPTTMNIPSAVTVEKAQKTPRPKGEDSEALYILYREMAGALSLPVEVIHSLAVYGIYRARHTKACGDQSRISQQ